MCLRFWNLWATGANKKAGNLLRSITIMKGERISPFIITGPLIVGHEAKMITHTRLNNSFGIRHEE